jgi:cysteine desulfurase
VLPGGTNADVIYLDDHATTRLDPRALEAMMPYLTETFGNPGSRHQPGALAEAAVASSRASVAELIGADRAEIIFTSGATEANYTALLGAGRARRGHIISSTDRPPSTRPV